MRIGRVNKTTCHNRYPETLRALSEVVGGSPPPVVLDVGASDGSASLATMGAIRFERYYVTDRYVEISTVRGKKGVFFYDDARPFLYANRAFVMFNELDDAHWVYSWIGKRLFSTAPSASRNRSTVVLRNPMLFGCYGNKVRIKPYNVFDKWLLEPVNLVIAANLLNRVYFSDSDIHCALRNLRWAMKGCGWLVIIDNRPDERSTIFRLENDRCTIEREIGGGCDIKSLVLA